jgi:hypothetical protein
MNIQIQRLLFIFVSSSSGLFAAENPASVLVEPPKVVAAYEGKPVPAPEGAIILFDGKDTNQWKGRVNKDDPTKDDSVKWRLDKEGYLEVVKGKGQGRGNSGVFISGFPEVQVLDSWENVTYFDGQAGALYKKSAPLVNASRPPGKWQCYDIYIQRATEDHQASITVFHNGHLIQDRFQTNDRRQSGTLSFQDHGNPVRFRNIWFKEGVTYSTGK